MTKRKCESAPIKSSIYGRFSKNLFRMPVLQLHIVFKICLFSRPELKIFINHTKGWAQYVVLAIVAASHEPLNATVATVAATPPPPTNWVRFVRSFLSPARPSPGY